MQCHHPLSMISDIQNTLNEITEQDENIFHYEFFATGPKQSISRQTAKSIEIDYYDSIMKSNMTENQSFSPLDLLSSLSALPLPCAPPLTTTVTHSVRVQAVKRPKINKRIPKNSPMDAYCFTDIFSAISEEDSHVLYDVYTRWNFAIPPRKEIRVLGIALGVSQARIKKWFDDQLVKDSQAQISNNHPVKDGVNELISLIEARSCSFQLKMEKLDEIIKSNQPIITKIQSLVR